MADYSSLRSGYDNHGPYTNNRYNESQGYISPATPKKKGTSNWVKFGIPIGLLIVVGAVVGIVLGIRASNKNKDGDAASSGSSSSGSSSADAKNEVGLFATATNSEFMVPIYPSTTNTAAFTSPTYASSSNAKASWPSDTFAPSSPDVLTVRPDRPRLIAPAYKWAALPDLIANDDYMKAWNETIFGNATDYKGKDPVQYFMDGDSGILDNCREIKMRIKAFGYAYRMTNDTSWADRAWTELENAVSTNFGPNDATKWNPAHFLDTAEMSAAFGIAYDWFYDTWDDTKKSTLRSNLITYGLAPGISAYTNATDYNGWWKTNTTGNWNCVCNSGLTLASLAILNDDDTGSAKQLLGLTVQDAVDNCANAVSDDGTWDETANYWYFGTTGHAEMASALMTATGSDYGLLDSNSNFVKTGDYHMHAYGPTSLFDWGDHGPNKFSTTANAMMLYAKHYNRPEFALFQRDRADAAEPWSMFWYDPTIVGAYWDGMPLDNFFDNALDQWVAMRSSWTDENALYVGMKAGMNQWHQTHNDLDVGDFVLDAMGTRWAGELGSADYRSPFYFSNDTQESARWTYYRKMTEGQNTILINQANQLVTATPSIMNSGSTGEKQGSSTVLDLDSSSTAFWVTDMSSAYSDATSVKRGVRLLNGRKQVLVQDEINSSGSIQWRMHTNATVTTDGSSATLERDGKTMKVSILSPSGASFTTSGAVRFSTDPTPPEPDQDNPGITVLIVALDAGTQNVQVLFSPQWGDGTSEVTPPSVDLANWSLTSHNS